MQDENDEKEQLAYLVISPNPQDGKCRNSESKSVLWIKFGDTSNHENYRSSEYNTNNPSLYFVTIYGGKQAEKADQKSLGKYLEHTVLKKEEEAEQVEVEVIDAQGNRSGRKFEWYKVVEDLADEVEKFTSKAGDNQRKEYSWEKFSVSPKSDYKVEALTVRFDTWEEARKFFRSYIIP
ncbi:hypothetical protein FDECE_13439 [Fusarium decemcellulare]|nr:hypothetical protein FDECE_13439 [Fusarium decemcellulare]